MQTDTCTFNAIHKLTEGSAMLEKTFLTTRGPLSQTNKIYQLQARQAQLRENSFNLLPREANIKVTPSLPPSPVPTSLQASLPHQAQALQGEQQSTAGSTVQFLPMAPSLSHFLCSAVGSPHGLQAFRNYFGSSMGSSIGCREYQLGTMKQLLLPQPQFSMLFLTLSPSSSPSGIF